MNLQLPFEPTRFVNRGLFATYYLEHRLDELAGWTTDAALEQTFAELQRLYQRVESQLRHANEAQTEQLWIRPVLDILWGADTYEVQPSLPSVYGALTPDYALFASGQARAEAAPLLRTADYWQRPIAILDAKAYAQPLDRRPAHAAQSPEAQISSYLYVARVRWGVLTNGRQWRLYERDRSAPGGVFYEANLEDLLLHGTPDDFRYFYHFFRRESFLPDATGKTFLEQVLEGSDAYALSVSERLRENVYDATRLIIQGFLRHPHNQLDPSNPDHLQRAYDLSLIVLYRILFLLYAEDRGMLPVQDKVYRDYCLQRMHREIRERLADEREYYPRETRFWTQLQMLTRLIDEGLPRNGDFALPAYDGGLFRPDAYPEIAHTPLPDHPHWLLGDAYLAKALYLLAYESADDPLNAREVDYASLDVQHLGTIYEGLLELQPRIATEPLIETVQNGQVVFKPVGRNNGRTLPNGAPPRRIEPGEVYLATDKGERKATGSFYTPQPVVQYILEQTLGELMDACAERTRLLRPEVDQRIAELEAQQQRELAQQPSNPDAVRQKYAALIDAERRRLLEPYLQVKVLDPALGSGHFLVGAADFISHRMAHDQSLYPAPEPDAQTYYKRLVVEHCLYGVDVNPLAVELAKLSLWLHTVSRGKALSFLDHRLRVGDSLLGASVETDLQRAPDARNTNGQLSLSFEQTLSATHLRYLLDTFRQIAESPSGDAETERNKARWYEAMDQVREKFRQVANCWLAAQFGVSIDAARYEQAIDALRDPARWQQLETEDWFQEAQRLAREYRFFHWELEFPEVFFNPDGLKPRAERGFDIVIGNPPYVSVRTGQIREEYNRILRQRWSLARGQWDLFALMVEAGLTRVRDGGYLSMVMPRRALTNENFEPLRRLAMEQYTLRKVLNAGTVFPEAKVEAAVLCLAKRPPEPDVEIQIYDLIDEVGVYQRSIPIRLVQQMPFLIVPYQFSVEAIELATRLRTGEGVVPLGDLVEITRGIEAGMNDPSISRTQTRRSQPLVTGEDVQRYRVLHSGYYVIPDPQQPAKFKSPAVYAPPKLLTRFVAVEPITAYDPVGYYNTNVLYNLRLKPNQPYSLHYLCALLNSRLIGWWFRLTFQSDEAIYPHIQKSQLERIPIRAIDFNLSAPQRNAHLQTALQLYDAYLEEPPPDYAAFLESELGAWAQARLQKGESVALHDLLARLAEQMHTLSLQIYSEKRGFLEWLYSHIGVRDPSALDDRADIENYDELSLEELLEILRRNHRRGQLARSPRPRETREEIQTEYENSLAKLRLLKRQMEATDGLIDYLICLLYGASAEEVREVALLAVSAAGDAGDSERV